MRRLAAGVLLGLGALAACAPVVTHAPRVEQGFSASAMAGARHNLCDTVCTAGLVPPIALAGRWGWLPRGPEGPGYQLGLSVPAGIAVPLTEVDLYAQAPAAPDAPVYGAGALVSLQHVMPYVQVGRVPPEGSGWYATLGYAWSAFRSEPDVFLNGGRGTVFDNLQSRFWVPTVAYRAAGNRQRLHVYLAAGLGTQEIQEFDAATNRYRTVGNMPVRVLMGGIAVEVPDVDLGDLPGILLPPRRWE